MRANRVEVAEEKSESVSQGVKSDKEKVKVST